jgi:UDP-N-acetylmuramoyl-tripeptide--D-alanyl-D-alanine ligase
LVEDVLNTLQSLAAYHRAKLRLPVIAVTGSNGKTTTKELIAAVLSQKFNISYTKENLNNHIGVPLTLLEMTDITDMGIVEMGANHPGEIEALCKIADPDFGIITNIGRAHLEGFGSFEGIKQTKAELYKYISLKNGTVFYNQDDLTLKELTLNLSNKISYGSHDADMIGEPVYAPPYLHVNIKLPEETLNINTKLTGMYNFENIMAAACIGSYFGITPSEIAMALQNYQPENNRSQIIKKNELTIVMDAYNANPTSMEAAIESFASGFQGPKCLIIGDMLELGQYTGEEHNKILRQIKKHSFEEVLLVGPAFSEASKGFPFKSFKDTAGLCLYLIENKLNGCAVLIKGSRGIRLEKVLDFL